MSETAYIAGPMTGIADFNYPAFNEAAARLRSLGFRVFNPAEFFGGDQTLPRETYMRRDILTLVVLSVDVVYTLPGWQESEGARLEVAFAQAIGIPIMEYETGEHIVEVPTRVPGFEHIETVLEEAQRLVHGARQESYGHPLDNFGQTGRMWAAILGVDDIPAETVGLMMVAAKLSRETNAHKRDNLVDAAGYAATVQMVIDERDARKA